MKKLVLILFIFTSCSVFKGKKQTKTTKDTNKTTTEKITRFQEADTTVIKVPNIIYKDTTIIKKGRTNTAYVNFDSKGKIDFQCINDKIQETIERTIQEQTQERIKENVKDKETRYDPKLILYIFIGLGSLIVVNKILNKFI